MYALRMPKLVLSDDKPFSGLEALLAGSSRVALFTDCTIRKAGLIDGVLDELSKTGIIVDVLDDLPAEPTVHQAAEIIRRFRALRADIIVAVGGGSVMDIAKLAGILDTDQYTIYDLLNNPGQAVKTNRTILIPTTAGTGAEATPNAIVTVPEQALKVGIVNYDMIADTVILNVEMIRKLPRKIAASTGIDALAHAIECYTSKKATPFSNLYALEAFRLIEANIEAACMEDTEDMSAKANMLLASFYAGVAIAAAGTTGVHALSYPLGGRYHIPHGISNAILLMPVMRYNEPCCTEEFSFIYDRVRPGGVLRQDDEKSKWVLHRMEEIVKNVGIHTNLSAYGIGCDDLEELVCAGMKVTRLLANNKREITAEDARSIYLEVMYCD